MQLTITKTLLDGVVVIEPKVFGDNRGFFYESWTRKDFQANGLDLEFVQDNHSRSSKGVLRGMHFQNMKNPLVKLIRCTYGEIYDVVVDLRSKSSTYGKWFGVILTAENKKELLVPIGFAHGFLSLSDIAEVQYKQTNYYNPQEEGGIIWNDRTIGIKWPIKNPQLSEKDLKLESFESYKNHPVF